MNLGLTHHAGFAGRSAQRGSVLVIVLLISLGLITISLYFANSMSLELRAADNRTSGLAADQTIEGAVRYISTMLSTYATNGYVPDPSEYSAEAVAVGVSTKTEENPRFWLIGRDPSGQLSSEPYFGLVDEASKIDLNAPWLTAESLETNFAGMTTEFAEAIIDWRDTNGTSSINYSDVGYTAKHAPFETVGELRLVFGATADLLAGSDINRNGVLDSDEENTGLNSQTPFGMLEHFTVYNREPDTLSDGSALTNVNTQADLQAVLEQWLGTSRATQIISTLVPAGPAVKVAGAGAGRQTSQTYSNLLQFYVRAHDSASMTADEFAQIYPYITAASTTTSNAFTVGRVNVNTASAEVLACIPGMDLTTAQQVVNYRESNAVNYGSFAWIVDALGSGSTALQALQQGDYITGKSYQFTADVAAVGPFGRGYRRVRFVFDLSEGTPKIIYRQDLSRLGWALGRQTRETWVAKNTR